MTRATCPVCDASDVARHVTALVEAGATPRGIGECSGVSSRLVGRLPGGLVHRIREDHAQAILAVTAEEAIAAVPAPIARRARSKVGQRRIIDRPDVVACTVCDTEVRVQRLGPVPRVCSQTCRTRANWRRSRGEPVNDRDHAEWAEAEQHRQRVDAALRALHEVQTVCAELGVPIATTSPLPVEPTDQAYRCVCGELLEEVPNPPLIVDTHAKWTAAGWCDSCTSTGRGFVIVTTRRPMKSSEAEPIRDARRTLRVSP